MIHIQPHRLPRILKKCVIFVLRVLQHVFTLVSLFSIEFDLWSSIKKDTVLSIVAYYISNGERFKLVLDTLPLLDGTSHSAEINHEY